MNYPNYRVPGSPDNFLSKWLRATEDRKTRTVNIPTVRYIVDVGGVEKILLANGIRFVEDELLDIERFYGIFRRR